MPYSITTKDGITINNIPDDVAPDSPELKARVAKIRAGGGTAALEAPAAVAAQPAQQPAPAPAVPERSMLEQAAYEVAAPIESGLALGTGFLSSIPAGLRGLFELARTQNPELAAQAVQETQQLLSYQPRGQTGQGIVGAVGQVGELMGMPGQYVGGKLAETGMPGAATVAQIGTDIATGGALGKVAQAGKAAVTARQVAKQQAAQAAARAETPPAVQAAQQMEQAPVIQPIAQRMQAQEAAAQQAGTVSPLPKMPEVKRVALSTETIEGGLSPKLTQDRRSVLEALGFKEGEMRTGAVQGDKWKAGRETSISKLEGGERMRAQFDLETEKLGQYAQQLATDLGTELKKAPAARGSTIAAPLEAYQAWYTQQISNLYKQADEIASQSGGIQFNRLQEALNKNSNFATSEAGQLRRGLRSYMKEQGLIDLDGNIMPMTAAQAEGVKQFMTPLWDRKNAFAVTAIKDALDEDVTQVLGKQVYDNARQARRQYNQIFEEPDSLAKILDVSGPGGINRAISHEKLPGYMANQAASNFKQFEHIMNVLDNMPTAELRQTAALAKQEIQGAILDDIFKNNLSDQFQWAHNPKSLDKAIGQYKGKLDTVFGVENADKLRTLQAGAHILKKIDYAPSGTAEQMQNLTGRAGTALKNLGAKAPIMESVGAGLGATAGPVGAMVGAVAGRGVSTMAAKRAFQKEIDKALQGSPKYH
jgi:hypothetical protein